METLNYGNPVTNKEKRQVLNFVANANLDIMKLQNTGNYSPDSPSKADNC